MRNPYDQHVQARVARMDGRTRVIAVWRQMEWEPAPRGTRFSEDTIRAMRAEQVSELELRRGLARARIPMSWLRRYYEEPVSIAG